MELWSVIDAINSHARVMTAVAPFAGAMLLRLAMGRNRLTAWLVSLTTMWFLVNVLLAPYSPRMREDLTSLRGWFH